MSRKAFSSHPKVLATLPCQVRSKVNGSCVKAYLRFTDFFRIGRHVGLKSREHRVAIYTRRFASRFLGADKSARQIADKSQRVNRP